MPFFEEFYFYCEMNFLRTLFYFRKTSMPEWLRRLIHPLRPDALIKKFRSKIFLSLNGEIKFYESLIATHVNSSHHNSGRRKKINFFYNFLWCLKRFYEGPKTFRGATKKCENKNKSIFILIQLSEMHRVGRV